MGRVNKSGKSIDKESYQYYTKLFQATKSYYKRKGYVNMIPSYAKGNKGKDYMSYDVWKFEHDINKTSNKELVYEQFHKYSKQTTQSLHATLKAKGIRISLSKLSRGEVPSAAWDAMKDDYHNLLAQGKSSAEAKWEISYMYWGSE